jgi:hypothetical protein
MSKVMSDTSWIPTRLFYVEDILKDMAIGGLKIGAGQNEIEASLGPPELPMARLGKRSKIWVSLYGNVSVLTSNEKVISIDIDFHGNRAEMVQAGLFEKWHLQEWKSYAQDQGWHLKPIGNQYTMVGDGITIGLDNEGEIGTLSLLE